jgi:hypothetical protein
MMDRGGKAQYKGAEQTEGGTHDKEALLTGHH